MALKGVCQQVGAEVGEAVIDVAATKATGSSSVLEDAFLALPHTGRVFRARQQRVNAVLLRRGPVKADQPHLLRNRLRPGVNERGLELFVCEASVTRFGDGLVSSRRLRVRGLLRAFS